jgi:hypothetical protein
MNGYAFLEDLSWEAFNEGTRLLNTVEQYMSRLGYYHKEVLVDKIYCTRENQKKIKRTRHSANHQTTWQTHGREKSNKTWRKKSNRV